MTSALPWHPTRTTDRAVYHDHTRCPEAAAIPLKHRRPGDGGREACDQCAQLLIETIVARLLPPGDPTRQ